MSETAAVDVVELARQIAMRMDPEALLDRADVAAMLKCRPRTVGEVYAKAEGFPKPYELKTLHGKSHPLYKRKDVQAYIDGHCPNPPKKSGGRPRRTGPEFVAAEVADETSA